MKLFIRWLVAGIVSYALAGAMCHYAISKRLIDIPNERRSHSLPTPGGGGLSIVANFSVTLIGFYWLMDLYLKCSIGVVCAGLLIAKIGVWDDRGHIPAQWLLHFIGGQLGLMWMDALPQNTDGPEHLTKRP